MSFFDLALLDEFDLALFCLALFCLALFCLALAASFGFTLCFDLALFEDFGFALFGFALAASFGFALFCLTLATSFGFALFDLALFEDFGPTLFDLALFGFALFGFALFDLALFGFTLFGTSLEGCVARLHTKCMAKFSTVTGTVTAFVAPTILGAAAGDTSDVPLAHASRSTTLFCEFVGDHFPTRGTFSISGECLHLGCKGQRWHQAENEG